MKSAFFVIPKSNKSQLVLVKNAQSQKKPTKRKKI